jgi:hypothetical protein
MHTKNKLWKYATGVVVVLIILNPEMAELAIFIDAIGLEMFLLLLEVQLIAVLSFLFNSRIRSSFTCVKGLCLRLLAFSSPRRIKQDSEGLLLATGSPAILMNTLAISYAIGILFFF